MSKRSVSPFERFGAARPGADATLLTHDFAATDTLTGLAERYFDDWRLWRVIAARNAVVDPRQIEIGTTLIIPRRPLEKGRYESL